MMDAYSPQESGVSPSGVGKDSIVVFSGMKYLKSCETSSSHSCSSAKRSSLSKRWR